MDVEALPEPVECDELRVGEKRVPIAPVLPPEKAVHHVHHLVPEELLGHDGIGRGVVGLPDELGGRVRELLQKSRFVVAVGEANQLIPDRSPFHGGSEPRHFGGALETLVVLAVAHVDEDGGAVFRAYGVPLPVVLRRRDIDVAKRHPHAKERPEVQCHALGGDVLVHRRQRRYHYTNYRFAFHFSSS
ncbi:MAG: hypothetical protein COT91_04895 [Candidatus Doudnabacteria bacterium CG10_big_fil_rev_8_21_14_0_10_41_10]|uniref:Uncharacterized protein n=1 Tax=Candidatus Doudnabacteria bacterium CG10_big_fil_rev_8_21_14_0_10_41_10 TaxID=1974551 RepID=A0A2H0VCC4_9BACT|nr:MAG: hypothetical protein COT91_04895 [Candidatus Doudnabacteria bacterium CG10_big_fil_rev_8_21_14_0_10_41_10]